MRVFVTGPTGFAGSYLVDKLLIEGHEVAGLVHASTSHQPWPDHTRFSIFAGDIMDLRYLKEVFYDFKPDSIYHLAGQASPMLSWENPASTIMVNTAGTANILEAARSIGYPRVVVVTSAQIYGRLSPIDMPITERTIPNPANPYGVSKWAAGQLVTIYWQKYGLPVIEARPFNHIGPRQTRGFVVPDFASQLAATKLGRHPPVIEVGNLSAERDFTDVRDVVRAYLLLAEKGKPGEPYLICSGKAISIQEILEILIGFTGREVAIRQDPERLRSTETSRIVGSYEKLQRDTGWRPKISLEQSLQDTLESWLATYTDEES